MKREEDSKLSSYLTKIDPITSRSKNEIKEEFTQTRKKKSPNSGGITPRGTDSLQLSQSIPISNFIQ